MARKKNSITRWVLSILLYALSMHSSYASIQFPKQTVGGIFEWNQVAESNFLSLGIGYGVNSNLNFIYQFSSKTIIDHTLNSTINYSKNEDILHGLFLSRKLFEGDIFARTKLGMVHSHSTAVTHMPNGTTVLVDTQTSNQLDVSIQLEGILNSFFLIKPLIQVETLLEFPTLQPKDTRFSIGSFFTIFENINSYLKFNPKEKLYTLGFTVHHSPIQTQTTVEKPKKIYKSKRQHSQRIITPFKPRPKPTPKKKRFRLI